tara:strand:- start:15 stop:722 length:708 start_codon:yes stop_codon:yes gene_type:complete
MGDIKQPIGVEEVLAYLEANPEFFLHHPDGLEHLILSSAPAGTISLSQRQTERLQARNNQLKEQLHSLIDTARQNTKLEARVHGLCLRLLDTNNLNSLLPLLMTELKQEFNADEIGLRLFYSESKYVLPEGLENITQCHIDDESLIVFDKVLERGHPVCGRLSNAQKTVLFTEVKNKVASIACLPIGHDPCCGLLAIASYDQDRFHSDMATDYLAFLGEVLMRLIKMHNQVNNGK